MSGYKIELVDNEEIINCKKIILKNGFVICLEIDDNQTKLIYPAHRIEYIEQY